MARVPMPPARVPITDGAGNVTLPWYSFFSSFFQTTADRVEVVRTEVLVSAPEDDGYTPAAVGVALARLVELESRIDEEVRTGAALAALTARVDELAARLDEIPDRGAELRALRRRLDEIETELTVI